MSALAPVRSVARAAVRAPARTPSRDTRSSTRPALRLVLTPRVAAARLPFALLVAAILGSGLVALLMLHTLAAQDGFTLHKLQRQSAGLADLEQQLTVANQQAQAPSSLAARARGLGMVPTGDLRIVRRRDGRVVAVASAMVIPRPQPKPAASPSPAAGSTPTAKPVTAASPGAKPAATGKHGKHRPPH